MPVDGARGNVVSRCVLSIDRVDDAGGKQAGQQCAQGSTGSVHAKRVQRVIVAEERLHPEYHERAEKSRRQADKQRRHGLHKA